MILERFRTNLAKEALLLLRDRKVLFISLLIPVLTIWAYRFVEPPAEVRFDERIFRTTDPTALVISLAVMFPAFMLGSGAIVGEKMGGTLRRLSRTPMHALEFVGAKMTVLFAVSLVQVLLVLVVAMTALSNITISDAGGFVFRVALVALAFTGTGLLVSSLSNTENQALVMTTFGVLVMLVLCGFLAPLEELGAAEPVARVLPYTHAYLTSYYFLRGQDSPAPYESYLLLDAVVTFLAATAIVHRYGRD